MISISGTRVGNNKPAIRLNQRVVTEDEYKGLDDEALMFLLGVKDPVKLRECKKEMDRIVKQGYKSPVNSIKKSTVTEIDSEIKRLQSAKKKLKGGAK